MHSNSIANDSIRAVHSVSDLCGKTRAVLEEKFAHLWVAGEIASISVPASGHWYLSLKDDKAQLRCVMFKSANSRCQKPKIGDEVLVSGRFSLYEARGDLQLILNHLEPRGAGALHKQFEDLKKKLLEEGLFAAEHKKILPSYPEHIALVTSSTGAALEDILTVLQRHNYGGRVSLFASPVQGENAPQQLINALQSADAQMDVDLILLSRGGGSYEDLFCFNDENLARAIFSTKKPVLSAVGHETDTTISDFVADCRSATPTAAAEQLLASYIGLGPELKRLSNSLNQTLTKNLAAKSSSIIDFRHRLQSPIHRLQSNQQQLDRLQQNQTVQMDRQLGQKRHELDLLTQRLRAQSSVQLIRDANSRLEISRTELQRLGPEKIRDLMRSFVQLSRHLETVSPMATITRGYSVLRDADQQVVTSVAALRVGDPLSAMVTDGTIQMEVTELEAKTPKPGR